jgi:hypothetical protein
MEETNELDALRQDIMGKFNANMLKSEPATVVEQKVVARTPAFNTNVGDPDMRDIINGIIENKIVRDVEFDTATEVLDEARKEVMTTIDWGLADDLFGV